MIFLTVGEDAGGGDIGQQALFLPPEPFLVVRRGTYLIGTFTQPLVGGDIGMQLTDTDNPARHLIGDGGVEKGKDRLFHDRIK